MSKILIVDDLPTEVQLMQAAIAKLGHSTIVATDGEQALEMARRENPDLVLLDVVLPRMDGFQVCRKIKKDAQISKIPVILVSSKTQASHSHRRNSQTPYQKICTENVDARDMSLTEDQPPTLNA